MGNTSSCVSSKKDDDDLRSVKSISQRGKKGKKKNKLIANDMQIKGAGGGTDTEDGNYTNKHMKEVLMSQQTGEGGSLLQQSVLNQNNAKFDTKASIESMQQSYDRKLGEIDNQIKQIDEEYKDASVTNQILLDKKKRTESVILKDYKDQDPLGMYELEFNDNDSFRQSKRSIGTFMSKMSRTGYVHRLELIKNSLSVAKSRREMIINLENILLNETQKFQEFDQNLNALPIEKEDIEILKQSNFYISGFLYKVNKHKNTMQKSHSVIIHSKIGNHFANIFKNLKGHAMSKQQNKEVTGLTLLARALDINNTQKAVIDQGYEKCKGIMEQVKFIQKHSSQINNINKIYQIDETLNAKVFFVASDIKEDEVIKIPKNSVRQGYIDLVYDTQTFKSLQQINPQSNHFLCEVREEIFIIDSKLGVQNYITVNEKPQFCVMDFLKSKAQMSPGYKEVQLPKMDSQGKQDGLNKSEIDMSNQQDNSLLQKRMTKKVSTMLNELDAKNLEDIENQEIQQPSQMCYSDEKYLFIFYRSLKLLQYLRHQHLYSGHLSAVKLLLSDKYDVKLANFQIGIKFREHNTQLNEIMMRGLDIGVASEEMMEFFNFKTKKGTLPQENFFSASFSDKRLHDEDVRNLLTAIQLPEMDATMGDDKSPIVSFIYKVIDMIEEVDEDYDIEIAIKEVENYFNENQEIIKRLLDQFDSEKMFEACINVHKCQIEVIEEYKENNGIEELEQKDQISLLISNTQIGKYYCMIDDFKNAKTYLDQAYATYRIYEKKYHTDYHKLAFNSKKQEEVMGIDVHQYVQTHMEKIISKDDQYELFNNMAKASRETGQVSDSLKFIEISYKFITDKKSLLSYQIEYGKALMHQKQFKQALLCNEKAYDLSKELIGEQDFRTLEVQLNLAENYEVCGNKAMAQKIFMQCMEIFDMHLNDEDFNKDDLSYSMRSDFDPNMGDDQLNDKINQKAENLNRIADALRGRNEYNKAVKLLKKSLAIKIKLIGHENHDDILYLYNQLALTYKAMEKYKEAVTCTQKAIEILKNQKLDETQDFIDALSFLAELHRCNNDQTEIIKIQEQTLKAQSQLFKNPSQQEVDMEFQLAKDMFSNNQIQQAIDYSLKALGTMLQISHFSQAEHDHKVIEIKMFLGQAYHKANQDDKALEILEEVSEYLESLHDHSTLRGAIKDKLMLNLAANTIDIQQIITVHDLLHEYYQEKQQDEKAINQIKLLINAYKDSEDGDERQLPIVKALINMSILIRKIAQQLTDEGQRETEIRKSNDQFQRATTILKQISGDDTEDFMNCLFIDALQMQDDKNYMGSEKLLKKVMGMQRQILKDHETHEDYKEAKRLHTYARNYFGDNDPKYEKERSEIIFKRSCMLLQSLGGYKIDFAHQMPQAFLVTKIDEHSLQQKNFNSEGVSVNLAPETKQENHHTFQPDHKHQSTETTQTMQTQQDQNYTDLAISYEKDTNLTTNQNQKKIQEINPYDNNKPIIQDDHTKLMAVALSKSDEKDLQYEDHSKDVDQEDLSRKLKLPSQSSTQQHNSSDSDDEEDFSQRKLKLPENENQKQVENKKVQQQLTMEDVGRQSKYTESKQQQLQECTFGEIAQQQTLEEQENQMQKSQEQQQQQEQIDEENEELEEDGEDYSWVIDKSLKYKPEELEDPKIVEMKQMIMERYNFDVENDGNYKLVINDAKVKNWIHQNETGPIMNAHCFMNVDGITVEEMTFTVGNLEFRAKWDENLKNKLSKIIEWNEEKEEGIALMYPKMPPVPFITQRELLQSFKVIRNFPDQGSNCVFVRSIELDEYPENKKFVRSNVDYNCIIIQPADSGKEDSIKFLMSLRNNVGGSMPQSGLQIGAKTMPQIFQKQTVQAMRDKKSGKIQ